MTSTSGMLTVLVRCPTSAVGLHPQLVGSTPPEAVKNAFSNIPLTLSPAPTCRAYTWHARRAPSTASASTTSLTMLHPLTTPGLPPCTTLAVLLVAGLHQSLPRPRYECLPCLRATPLLQWACILSLLTPHQPPRAVDKQGACRLGGGVLLL